MTTYMTNGFRTHRPSHIHPRSLSLWTSTSHLHSLIFLLMFVFVFFFTKQFITLPFNHKMLLIFSTGQCKSHNEWLFLLWHCNIDTQYWQKGKNCSPRLSNTLLCHNLSRIRHFHIRHKTPTFLVGSTQLRTHVFM